MIKRDSFWPIEKNCDDHHNQEKNIPFVTSSQAFEPASLLSFAPSQMPVSQGMQVCSFSTAVLIGVQFGNGMA